MRSFSLRDIRLRDRDGLWDLSVVDGRVAAISEAGSGTAIGEQHHLGGALVLPGMVDAHVHLDKAFQLSHLGDDAADLKGALAATAALRGRLDARSIEANAERVVATMVSGGTVAARIHVEIAVDSDPGAVRMHRDIAASHPGFAFELVAFAQHGTTSDRSTLVRMDDAMRQGCTVVGGCPYADPDPLQHLDDVIALAKHHDAPLDLHLDLSDRAEDLMLDQVVPLVEKAGLQGRVVVGHLTTLTALRPERVRELVAALHGAAIAVVAIPTTDLFLSGREHASAPTRGVTRIAELVDGGVRVALASNNYENAFTPVSMPSLTHAAWLASLTNYMSTERQQLSLLDAITTVPRSVVGCDVPGIGVGDLVGAAVFDVERPVDVVRSAARPVALVTADRGVVVPHRLVDRAGG